jgi:hypothetical protein
MKALLLDYSTGKDNYAGYMFMVVIWPCRFAC